MKNPLNKAGKSGAKFDMACELIEGFSWDSILSDDVDTSWSQWSEKCLQIMERYIPQTIVKTNNKLLWMNRATLLAIRNRNKVYRLVKRSPSSVHYYRYKRLRNLATKQLRKAKASSFSKLF